MKKNKNLLNKSNKLKFDFFTNISGSILIPFAIMLPSIGLISTAGINNSQILKEKIALSNATNESALALVALNNKNNSSEDKEKNREMALNYINYYLTHKINSNLDNKAKININYNDDTKEYRVSYQRETETLMKLNTLGSLGNSLTINNDDKSYGNTRKQILNSDKYDIAFVADFSGSATCPPKNSSCNIYDRKNFAGSSRLDEMANSIKKIISNKSNFGYKFALIPYDIGVPILSEEKNRAGGNTYSCSIPYKLIKPFDKVDYNFWANKGLEYDRWKKLKESQIILDYLTYDYFTDNKDTLRLLDYNYYLYYQNVIGPAFGLFAGSETHYTDDYQLLTSGLCEKNHNSAITNKSKHYISCGTKNSDYPLSDKNLNKVKDQYGKILQLHDYMYISSNMPGKDPNHYSFANNQTVDVKGTINSLFSRENKAIIFNRPITHLLPEFTPFQHMCMSPIYSNNIMDNYTKKTNRNNLYQNTADHYKKFIGSPHLVELTEGKNIIRSLNQGTWKPGGGTDTMSGLLTAVPVLAQGEGTHKIIIIITDGKDDSGADILRDKFIEQGVCQTIRDGLLSEDYEAEGIIKKAAVSSVIHFIKLSPTITKSKNSMTERDYKKEFGKWYDCVNQNPENLHFAGNDNELIDVTNNIIESETGNFIAK